VGAAGVGAAVTLVVTWRLTRPIAALGFQAAPSTWRSMLGASLPVGIALALNELYVRADTIIISLYRDFDEVGFYSLAYRILEITGLLGTAFLTSVFPLMSRHAHSDRARFRETVQAAWDAFVILGMPVAACGAVLAPQIVELAGGSDFAEAAEPLRFLFCAGALAFVNGVIGYGLIAVDRQKKALWLNVVGLATNVALNLLLVPEHGIVAAAVITVSTELLVLAGGLWLARRHLGFVPGAGVVPAAAVAAGVTAGVLLALPVETLLVLAPVAALLYAGLVLTLSARGRRLAAGALGR
jgi:O-antigen/teichoic acid export membrane protein